MMIFVVGDFFCTTLYIVQFIVEKRFFYSVLFYSFLVHTRQRQQSGTRARGFAEEGSHRAPVDRHHSIGPGCRSGPKGGHPHYKTGHKGGGATLTEITQRTRRSHCGV